jgi:gamma-glutamyltranspeptidase
LIVVAPSHFVVAGRSKIATSYGIVATSQPLAAQAGVQILERGDRHVRRHPPQEEHSHQG